MVKSRRQRSSTTKIRKVGELSLLDLTSPLLIPGEAPESGPAIGEVEASMWLNLSFRRRGAAGGEVSCRQTKLIDL